MTAVESAALVAVAAVAGVVTWLVTPLAARVATARGWMDVPSGHKAHPAPVPYLGGAAVGVGIVVALIAGTALVEADVGDAVAIVVVALAVGVLGLTDDVRELPIAVRLAVEVTAAVALYALGVRAQLSFVPAVDVAVTVVWVVGVANAFNLIDNMDGLSSGVAAVAGLGLSVIAGINGELTVAVLSAAIVGACVGFLAFNRHPARVHLGDSGALLLGVLLAALAMALRFDGPRSITFAVPIMILGVPLFDMVLVVVHRLRVGRSPWEGGRDHVSHRLIAVGIPVPGAVTLIHGAGLALSWLALVLSRLDTTTGFILQAFVVAVGLLIFVLLSRVPIGLADETQPDR